MTLIDLFNVNYEHPLFKKTPLCVYAFYVHLFLYRCLFTGFSGKQNPFLMLNFQFQVKVM